MSPLARAELRGHRPPMPWRLIGEGLAVVAAGLALLAATFLLQV